MGEPLDGEQAAAGMSADLAQMLEVVEVRPTPKSRVSLMVGSVRRAPVSSTSVEQVGNAHSK